MQRTITSSVTPGSVATRTPFALALRRESVWVSDFDVGHSTTSNCSMSAATSGGGSSPFVLRGGISTMRVSLPRPRAASNVAYPMVRSGASVTTSTRSPG